MQPLLLLTRQASNLPLLRLCQRLMSSQECWTSRWQVSLCRRWLPLSWQALS